MTELIPETFKTNRESSKDEEMISECSNQRNVTEEGRENEKVCKILYLIASAPPFYEKLFIPYFKSISSFV